MSQSKSSARSSASLRSLLFTAIGLAVAAALGILVAVQVSGPAGPSQPSQPSRADSLGHARNAYRPSHGRALAVASDGAPSPESASRDVTGAGRRSEEEQSQEGAEAEALSPELETRLRAAAHVAVVTARPGAPLPPAAGSLPPESELARQQAMIGWQSQVQTLLDRCVARPAGLRKPTALEVILTPPLGAVGLVEQTLAASAVSLPPDELRRLWRDTDPDALDRCLQEVRALTVAVTPLPGSTARVMPTSFERLVVQL